MANLFAVRAFELVCVVAWLAGLVWVWRSRNWLYAGVYFGSSTLMVFDWIFNTSWFFKVIYDPQFIPLWQMQGVVQPVALVANYAFFFGVPVLLFVQARDAMDRRFGGWGYLAVFLVGALLDLGFEIPMVKLGLWTYYQQPQFLIGGLPYSNVWYSGLLFVACYGAARLAVRWAGSLKDRLPEREERWRGFGMGAAAIWSAVYASMSVQLIWYGLAQPWIQGPRPF